MNKLINANRAKYIATNLVMMEGGDL